MKHAVTQEHGAGCAVACMAYALDLSYRKALNFFPKPEQAWKRGFYCRDIIRAFKRAGQIYSYGRYKSAMKKYLKIPGTIVFVSRSKKYPLGHYLVKGQNNKWMNPWLNFPVIAPAKNGFQKRLPGKPSYVIFSK